jgi:hypothetical protein
MRWSGLGALLALALLVATVAWGVSLERRGLVSSTGCAPAPDQARLELAAAGSPNATSLAFDVRIANPTAQDVRVDAPTFQARLFLSASGKLQPLATERGPASGGGPDGTIVPANASVPAPWLRVAFDPSQANAADPTGDYVVAEFAGGLCGEGRAQVKG